MNDGQPSHTALSAAAARAAHLIVDDDPPIFSDTMAYTLLGELAEELIGYHRAHGDHPILVEARTTAIARSRCTEDRLAEGLRRGIAQYVILGAGLDSFAYRSERARDIRVFEVDHPATQRWKRRRLADAKIAYPETLTFVPVDFESESFLDALAERGFDPARPAFVSWLGVATYLSGNAVAETVAALGGLAPGTEVVIGYMLPHGLRDATGQAYVDAVGAMAAEHGEPWLTFLSPDEMTSLLAKHGFESIEQIRQRDMVDPALWDRTDPLRPSELSMLAHAAVGPR